jgi:RNA polymerase sigma factor (sigma-70 family)
VLADSELAERATQDTFTAASCAIAGYEPTEDRPVRVWLFSLAANAAASTLLPGAGLGHAADPIRIARRRESEISLDPQLRALSRLDDRHVLAALGRIPTAQCQVLMLRYMFGLTSREIAAVLECSDEEARVLQHGAMTKLSDSLHRGRNVAQPSRA